MATIDDVFDLLEIVDAKVDAIKAKTDQLSFTGGKIDAVTSGATSSAVLAGERFEDFAETTY